MKKEAIILVNTIVIPTMFAGYFSIVPPKENSITITIQKPVNYFYQAPKTKQLQMGLSYGTTAIINEQPLVLTYIEIS